MAWNWLFLFYDQYVNIFELHPNNFIEKQIELPKRNEENVMDGKDTIAPNSMEKCSRLSQRKSWQYMRICIAHYNRNEHHISFP